MRRALALAGLAGALACAGAEGEWEASGVVREVRPAEATVKIEHGDIEGLMPAMTMSFDVADPALLAGLEAGQFVEFRLARAERGFEIVALHAPEGGSSGSGGRSEPVDPLAGSDDVAPPFALVDQQGRPVTLASLRGGPVVLDFIFTRCAGPCPILTGLLADAREALAPEDRARVRFVSITLDPAHDTPERLAEYARARRVDTEGWSFLTGPPEEVDAVVRAYGVGATPSPQGANQIDHTLASFLIDAEGQIAKRWLGLRHEPEAMAREIAGLL